MPMNETLREAGPADADRIAALVNRAFLAESWFKSVDRTNASQVRHLLGKGVFLLLEEDSRLLACVYLEPRGDRVYLGMLSVEQDVQGRGIGRRMMQQAEEFRPPSRSRRHRSAHRTCARGIAAVLPQTWLC